MALNICTVCEHNICTVCEHTDTHTLPTFKTNDLEAENSVYTQRRGRNNEALIKGEQVGEIRTMKQARKNEEGTPGRPKGIKQIIKHNTQVPSNFFFLSHVRTRKQIVHEAFWIDTDGTALRGVMVILATVWWIMMQYCRNLRGCSFPGAKKKSSSLQGDKEVITDGGLRS